MVSPDGWYNKRGTALRKCSCGSWKDHWINFSGESWPDNCSVYRCTETPTLGAHIYKPTVSGEKIVPMCSACNALDEEFDLNVNVPRVSANRAKTCGYFIIKIPENSR